MNVTPGSLSGYPSNSISFLCVICFDEGISCRLWTAAFGTGQNALDWKYTWGTFEARRRHNSQRQPNPRSQIEIFQMRFKLTVRTNWSEAMLANDWVCSQGRLAFKSCISSWPAKDWWSFRLVFEPPPVLFFLAWLITKSGRSEEGHCANPLCPITA